MMKTIEDIKRKAMLDKIPIMEDEGIELLTKLIKDQSLFNILEAGSAVGYSAIMMALVDDKVKVTTIEKDSDRYNVAKENILVMHLDKRINCVYGDAREYESNEKYDLLVVDAAKIANRKIFDHLSNYVKVGGYIFTDDIWLHGFTDKPEEITSKHFKKLIMSIIEFKKYVETNKNYKSNYYQLGDGILISKKLR